MSDTIEYKDKGLKNLIRMLKKNKASVRVGILGGHNARKEQGTTNASIGVKHEFGREGMPMRSFLRMPLNLKLQKYLNKTGFYDASKIAEMVNKMTFVPWLDKIGVVCEAVIQDAFASGGFGQWKPSDMRYKQNHQTLVETQQLRNSITHEVKEG